MTGTRIAKSFFPSPLRRQGSRETVFISLVWIPAYAGMTYFAILLLYPQVSASTPTLAALWVTLFYLVAPAIACAPDFYFFYCFNSIGLISSCSREGNLGNGACGSA
jgi:hypothetical protein